MLHAVWKPPVVNRMSAYARAIGARLRRTRHQQELSLQAVEEKSKGRWKAVVIGSYERGDRAISAHKLTELADFYNVPVAELLSDDRRAHAGAPVAQVVLDLSRLADVPADQAGPLARYVARIQSLRGDYSGRVLAIRSGDLQSVAIMYDITAGELTALLISWGVLSPEACPDREVLVGQLQAALRSRIRLEQARGVLAERSRLQIDQASTLLNDYGRDHGLPLDEIVGAILDGSASGTATSRKAEALSDRDRDSLPLGAGSAAEPA